MQLETKKEDILKGLQTVQNGIAQKKHASYIILISFWKPRTTNYH
jgi:hypothetical protein